MDSEKLERENSPKDISVNISPFVVRSMSGVDEVIKRILAVRPELTREAVEMMIEEEKSRSGGLLTEEAAAHIVASVLGLQAGQRIEAKTRIGRLTTGLGDISVTGRIICIFPERKFMRSDGREGKVVRMLLGDSTGNTIVVLWDEKADLVSAGRLQPSKIVRILHGYTRERQGQMEINLGRRGELYLEPMDIRSEDLPDIETFFLKPGQIRTPGRVNLAGVVIEKRPPTSFKKRDGTNGQVMRVRLSDLENSEITLVLWDDVVDNFEPISVGTRLRITDAQARQGNNGEVEVHISRSTWLEVVETNVDLTKVLAGQTFKIGEIKAGMRNINLQARVGAVGEVRAFDRRGAPGGKVVSILLQDESGSIRLSLWDKDVEILGTIKQGDTVNVEKAYAREGLGGLNLSLGSDGKIFISHEQNLMPQLPGIVKIEDLRENAGSVNITGTIVEAPSVRDVTTQRGDTVKVASFIIDDGTGEARVSVWRQLVSQVQDLSLGAKVTIENCYARPSYAQRKEVTSGTFTKITVS